MIINTFEFIWGKDSFATDEEKDLALFAQPSERGSASACMIIAEFYNNWVEK